jgi:LemA protein
MKKLLDMVEQLVESTKSYAHFERDTLEQLTKMRASIGNASTEDLTKIYGASKDLVGNVVAESYPNLKASEAVMATISIIRDVEDEISRHRYTYNNIIQEFNTHLDTFPSNIVASFTSARKRDYLNFGEDELRRRGYLSLDESLESERPEVKWE